MQITHPYVLDKPFDAGELLYVLAGLATAEPLRKQLDGFQVENLSEPELELALNLAAATSLTNTQLFQNDIIKGITFSDLSALQNILLLQDWDGLEKFLEKFSIPQNLIELALDRDNENQEKIFRIMQGAVKIKLLAEKYQRGDIYDRASAIALQQSIDFTEAVAAFIQEIRTYREAGEAWKTASPADAAVGPHEAKYQLLTRFTRTLVQRFLSLSNEGAVSQTEAEEQRYLVFKPNANKQALKDLERFEERIFPLLARSELRPSFVQQIQVLTAKIFAGSILPVVMALVLFAKPAEAAQVLEFATSAETQNQNLAHLQSMLGIAVQASDGFILSPKLMQQGFLVAAEKIFPSTPFVVIVSGLEKTETKIWIAEHGLQGRIFVAENIQIARSELRKHGASRIQGLAFAGEETFASMMNVVRFTTGQLQRLYAQAGILGEVQRLARTFSAFASAA